MSALTLDRQTDKQIPHPIHLPPLQEAGSKRGTSKFEVYSEIMHHFRPVLHHFFMEHFPCPSEWFERRLTYTRAVATSSIGEGGREGWWKGGREGGREGEREGGWKGGREGRSEGAHYVISAF